MEYRVYLTIYNSYDDVFKSFITYEIMSMIWLSIVNIQDAMFSCYNQQCHLFANCVPMIYY